MKMKTKLTKSIIYCFLLSVAIVLSSCTRNEDDFTDQDQTVETIATGSQLYNLLVSVSQDTSENENAIDCAGFDYPITILIYDENGDQTGTETIISDSDLFQFLSGLGDNQSISLQFPVSIILNDGTTVEVTDNSELQNIITSCTEDETSNTIDTQQLETDLTTGVWYVTYYFDDVEETDNFGGYEFTFNTDQTAQATNGSNTVSGNWSINDDDTPDLVLFFGETDPFDELDEDWEILEATDEIIRLQDISGDGTTDLLTFERTPTTGGGNNDVDQFSQTITDGTWYVNVSNDDGDDETCDYAAYEFNFNADGSTTAVSNTDTVNGTWSAIIDDNQLKLVLSYEFSGQDDPFEDLNDDWDVLEFDTQHFNLRDISGGNGGTHLLNFGRQPVTGCNGGGGNDVQDLMDTLEDGEWKVASYVDDGNDQTADYTDFVFDFNSDGTATATDSNGTTNGTWSVIIDDNELNLVLNFGTAFPLEELEDDWDVLNFTDVLVELQDISGGNGGTDSLTFEKL